MCFRPDTGHCRRDLTGKCAIKIVIKHAQNWNCLLCWRALPSDWG
jgi:hypothetical protein